jgi:hypothetical protein
VPSNAANATKIPSTDAWSSAQDEKTTLPPTLFRTDPIVALVRAAVPEFKVIFDPTYARDGRLRLVSDAIVEKIMEPLTNDKLGKLKLVSAAIADALTFPLPT